MPSSSRIAASPVNGKKSRWPVTPPVKTRSNANDAWHSFDSPASTAKIVCLKNENQSDFIKLHEALIAKHAAATFTEHFMVQGMAIARWRLQYAQRIESAQLVKQMDQMMDDPAQTYASMDGAARAALCIRTLKETSPSFKFLLRYKRSLSRRFDLSLNCLALLRGRPENEYRETNPKMNNRKTSTPERSSGPATPSRRAA